MTVYYSLSWNCDRGSHHEVNKADNIVVVCLCTLKYGMDVAVKDL